MLPPNCLELLPFEKNPPPPPPKKK